jgi:hypothetical protein
MPGYATFESTSPRALHAWQTAALAAGGFDGVAASSPKEALDTTREKGEEFPRSSPKSARGFDASKSSPKSTRRPDAAREKATDTPKSARGFEATREKGPGTPKSSRGFDTTREKGAEWPGTPKGKVSPGGNKVKGVWSSPVDTMQMSPGQEIIYSL